MEQMSIHPEGTSEGAKHDSTKERFGEPVSSWACLTSMAEGFFIELTPSNHSNVKYHPSMDDNFPTSAYVESPHPSN